MLFVTSALGVIPTAALMGRATEELAARAGPGIGGLLNVTFGNAPELIIALFALNEGLQEVTKASIVGSIIGNVLLVMGASMFVGGLGRERQTFNITTAGAQSSMLLLAVIAMMMPAVFELVEGQGLPSPSAELVDYDSDVEQLSLITALRPDRRLRQRADLLAAHASRPLQPGRRVRPGGPRRRAVERAPAPSPRSRSPAPRSR